MSKQLCPSMDILPLVAGRRVAVVGHASSQLGRRQGEEIDSADVVVRFHGKRIFDGRERDLGSRVHLWYTGRSHLQPMLAGVSVCGRKPDLAERIKRHWDPVFPKKHTRLTPPGTYATTGLVAIVDCLLSAAALVRVYGFDLFASPDIDTGETAADTPQLQRPAQAVCLLNDRRRLRTIVLDGCPVWYDNVLWQTVMDKHNQLPEN